MIKVDIAKADNVHLRISLCETQKRSSAVSNQREKFSKDRATRKGNVYLAMHNNVMHLSCAGKIF